MLVRTKAQNKIDCRIRVLFENGCYEVWIKERSMCDCELRCIPSLKLPSVLKDDEKDSSKVQHVSETVGGASSGNFEQIGGVMNEFDDGAPYNKNNTQRAFDDDESDSLFVEDTDNMCNEAARDRVPISGKTLMQVDDPMVAGLLAPHTILAPTHIQSFDPIVSIEAAAIPRLHNVPTIDVPPLTDVGLNINVVGSLPHVCGTTSKRPRGRLKKIVPTFSTEIVHAHDASRSLLEAQNTWETAKLLGITSNDENAMISNLRRSKRLNILEDLSPKGV